MRIDSIAVELRPRPMFEAADLGVRLLQRNARMVARCWLPVALAVLLLALSSVLIATWLPAVLIFWFKPWLGRTVLYVLGRAAFGQPTSWDDLWRARHAVWARQLWRAFTIDRLIPWRAFVMPVVTLEGLSGRVRRQRVAQLARGQRGVAATVNAAYANVELILVMGLVALVLLMAPLETGETLWGLVMEQDRVGTALALAGCSALIVLIVEPFHVASGFAMYLNRRVELEAWDIEQELRRAFVLPR
jgi:hypothetical protein